jgi:hypothetical protein
MSKSKTLLHNFSPIQEEAASLCGAVKEKFREKEVV